MVCVELITEIGMMIIPTVKGMLLVKRILSKVGRKLGNINLNSTFWYISIETTLFSVLFFIHGD